MEYPEKRLSKHQLTGLVLNVTDACNLGCRYCFTDPNPRKMSVDTGIQAIDWFISENDKKELERYPVSLTISFFGGEPSLRWDDFIVPIVNYVDEYIKPKYSKKFQITFSMTTNGQLLTKEKIDWFINNDGHFLLSIDGDSITQNYNRPRLDGKDSFEPVNAIIDDLLAAQPNVTFRSTVIPETVEYLSANYLFARKRGFLNYFCTPNIREEWSQEKLTILENEMNTICGIILADIENDQIPLCLSDINRMIKNILNGSPSRPHYMRCGLGTTSIGVSTDGSLSACQENSTYYDQSNIFYIGDVFNGIDKEKHLKLLSNFDGEKLNHCGDCNKCSQCEIAHICQSWSCPSSQYALSGDPLQKPEAMCNWQKLLYRVTANLILNAAEMNSTKFLDFVKQSTEFK